MIPTIPQERETKQPKRRHASGRPRQDCASRSSDSELSVSEISPSLAPEETDSGNVGTPISNRSDEERSDGLMFWFPNDETEKPPTSVASNREAAVPLIDRHRIVSRQHDYIHDQLAGEIDPQRYTLLVNTLDAIATVRWREVERTSCLRGKYSSAKKLVDSKRKMGLSASCSSSMPRYSVESIRRRIQRWRAWHSSWVYETRPTT